MLGEAMEAHESGARWESQISRRRALKYGLTGLAGLAGAALIGCGDSNEAGSATATAVSGTAVSGKAAANAGTAVASATGAVTRGGKFAWSFQSGLTNIDPHIERIHTFMVGYNKLVKNMPDGSQALDLASSVELPDAQTFIFKLQKGVKFHNIAPVNGREMTAEDVVYSIKRMTTPKPEFQKKYYFDRVKSVEAVDNYTVKLVTSGPFAPQLGYAGSTHACIVPKEVSDFREIMIGTGPFILKQNRPQVSLTATRNPDYFRAGRPYLDELEHVKVADTATTISRFRSGQLDWVTVNGKDAVQLRGQKWQEQQADAGSSQLRFNVTQKPFDDPRVRRALHLAIDRKQVIDIVLGGAGYIYSDIPRYFPAALQADELQKMPGFRADKQADMTEAKQLLKAAGFSGEFQTISYSAIYSDIAQLLNSQFAPLGVSIKPIQMQFSEWTTLVLQKKFQAMLTGSSQRDELDEYYYAVYHPKGARNDTGFSDPAITALVEQQQQESDAKKRNAIVRDVTLKMLEQPAWIPLYTGLAYDFLQPAVKGLQRDSVNYWGYLTEDISKSA